MYDPEGESYYGGWVVKTFIIGAILAGGTVFALSWAYGKGKKAGIKNPVSGIGCFSSNSPEQSTALVPVSAPAQPKPVLVARKVPVARPAVRARPMKPLARVQGIGRVSL